MSAFTRSKLDVPDIPAVSTARRARRARIGAACLLLVVGGAWADVPNEPTASPAQKSASAWLEEAYRLKAAQRQDEALAAFAHAQSAGADAATISLERGYILATRDRADEAEREFEKAAASADPEIAAAARRELSALRPPAAAVTEAGASASTHSLPTATVVRAAPRPRLFHFDLYSDAFLSHSLRVDNGNNLVPTLRLRVLYRPFRSVDFNLYLFAQATRDTASTSGGAAGLPRIYSDNYALFGAGALFRFWRSRFGVFAQVGPAVNELSDTDAQHPRVALDARGGLVFYAETARCAPVPVRRAAWSFTPCFDGYGEVVYTSRFDHNVVAFAHPRAAATYLRTGPVAWQAQVAGRIAKDLNGNFYNNFADAGPGARWRLLAPFRLDVTASVNGGSYFGIARAGEPAPSPLHYLDVRLEAATYVEF